MSASNWAICPECLAKAKASHLADCERVHALYGQIESADWREQLAALREVDEEQFRTFREDYEFYGVESGEITADYSGHCTVCNAGVDFKYSRRFTAVAA